MLCLALTGFLTIKGFVSIGDLTLYNSYFLTFVSKILSLTNMVPTIAVGNEAINSIGEILDSDDIECQSNKISIGNFERRT